MLSLIAHATGEGMPEPTERDFIMQATGLEYRKLEIRRMERGLRIYRYPDSTDSFLRMCPHIFHESQKLPPGTINRSKIVFVTSFHEVSPPVSAPSRASACTWQRKLQTLDASPDPSWMMLDVSIA